MGNIMHIEKLLERRRVRARIFKQKVHQHLGTRSDDITLAFGHKNGDIYYASLRLGKLPFLNLHTK